MSTCNYTGRTKTGMTYYIIYYNIKKVLFKYSFYVLDSSWILQEVLFYFCQGSKFQESLFLAAVYSGYLNFMAINTFHPEFACNFSGFVIHGQYVS